MSKVVGRNSLQDEFREGRSKSVVVPQTIDAVRQQDRNVTYREIEPTLGISVYRWYAEFNRGHSSLQDELCEGRSKSVVVPESIDAVRQLILQDRHVTYLEIETTLSISETSIYLILHEHLTQFVNRPKKNSCQLLEKNAPKIRSRFFETRL